MNEEKHRNKNKEDLNNKENNNSSQKIDPKMDRVSELYYGKVLDKTMKEYLQNRIEWIFNNIKGNNILDVGCSQGIMSILLGEKGFKVTGIDSHLEVIKYANKDLAKRSEKVRNNVEFIYGNFVDYDFKDKKYDTVIMGEIIEHVYKPENLFKKASKVVKDDGVVIITTPFGLLRHPDHKQTFYIKNFKRIF